MTVNYPSQFTGQAALSKQDPAAFKLDKWSYTPRKFTEDDVIIKIECCGICGVSTIRPSGNTL
jgi:alcohol dehydrogenase (NADP+)